MKKTFVLVFVAIMLVSVFLTGCECQFADYVPREDSSLEFWIAENVDDVDFSDYIIWPGSMGSTRYYGKGYYPVVDEEGKDVPPEHRVIYWVTSYPDYSCKTQHVTRISITDPKVEVYGLTLESPFEEVERVMENEGFEIRKTSTRITAVKEKFSFSFFEDEILIMVEIENKSGIHF